MGQYDGIVKLILANADLLGTLLVMIIGMLKLTAWGQAKSEALDTVIGVIEQLAAKEVKGGVAAREGNLTPNVQEAIRDAVAKADPKKMTPDLGFIGRLMKAFGGRRDR